MFNLLPITLERLVIKPLEYKQHLAEKEGVRIQMKEAVSTASESETMAAIGFDLHSPSFDGALLPPLGRSSS